MKGKYLYVAYDKQGLPMVVADSAQELSNILGISLKTIYRNINNKIRFAKVRWIND